MAQPPLNGLFWPTPRDQQGTLWGPRFTSLERTVAATTVEIGAASSVPWPLVGADYLEWIENIRVRAIPGAAQNIERIDLSIADQLGQGLVGLHANPVPYVAGAQGVLQVNPRVPMIGDRHTIRAVVTFNAGAAANQVFLGVASVVTIRGNIATF